MRFELLNDPGAHAFSSSPGCIVTQHLEKGAFWTALSAGGPAPGQQRQGGSSLNSTLWKPTVSYSEGRLPPWKQECFQYVDT